MAQVQSFKALFYNSKKVDNFKKVFVPPYDVISQKELKAYLKESKYSFARIILGNKKNHYAAVKKTFNQWQKRRILIEDDASNFYYWEQSFKIGNKGFNRKGIVCAVRLNDFYDHKVRPHENTHEGPKADRLEIMKATKANLSPIFMMYDDAKKQVEKIAGRKKAKPFFQVKDKGGVSHKIWKVENKSHQNKITKCLAGKNFYIVDGHHRFATALNYKKELGLKGRSEYVMSFLSNMRDPSLIVYPIYRILPAVKNFNKAAYLKSLSPLFKIKQKKQFGPLKPRSWGIVFKKDATYYELTSISHKKIISKMKGSKAQKAIDVSVLEQLILPKTLRSKITYCRGMKSHVQETLKDLKQGKTEVMWMASAPPLSQLKRVSDERNVMPQKSTFFYPKLLSGPLIRLL